MKNIQKGRHFFFGRSTRSEGYHPSVTKVFFKLICDEGDTKHIRITTSIGCPSLTAYCMSHQPFSEHKNVIVYNRFQSLVMKFISRICRKWRRERTTWHDDDANIFSTMKLNNRAGVLCVKLDSHKKIRRSALSSIYRRKWKPVCCLTPSEQAGKKPLRNLLPENSSHINLSSRKKVTLIRRALRFFLFSLVHGEKMLRWQAHGVVQTIGAKGKTRKGIALAFLMTSDCRERSVYSQKPWRALAANRQYFAHTFSRRKPETIWRTILVYASQNIPWNFIKSISPSSSHFCASHLNRLHFVLLGDFFHVIFHFTLLSAWAAQLFSRKCTWTFLNTRHKEC